MEGFLNGRDDTSEARRDMPAVLFVDDDIQLLRVLERRVRRLLPRWTLVFVDQGSDAVALLARQPFDGLVTDFRMPGISGAEVLEACKKSSPATIRVLYTSTDVDRSRVAANYVVDKSDGVEVLVNLLKRVIHRDDDANGDVDADVDTARIDEERRQASVDALRFVTDAKLELDGLTRLASELCGTSWAMVSIVDGVHDIAVSVYGIDLTIIPRDASFCGHVVMSEDLMIVMDTQDDARFAENPLVIHAPYLRFYAGAPLHAVDGSRIGALCVLDPAPQRLTLTQQRGLATLARQVELHFELRLRRRQLASQAEALRRQAELARDLAVDERDKFFAMSLDPMCVFSSAGFIVRANRAFNELFGFSLAELQQIRNIDLVHPDDEATVTQISRALAADPAQPRRVTARYQIHDRSYVWLEWTVMMDAGHGQVYAIARDQTEHLRREAENQHAQKMEALGRITSSIAHDFNNLLAVITMTSAAIEELSPPESPVLEEIATLQEASKSAISLTRQLLAFSRKGETSEYVSLDLAEVVLGVERLVRRILPAGVYLHVRTGPALGAIRGNATQVQQVFMNLILNARDAMPGGGTITIHVDNVHDSGVRAIIRDTGAGMDEATRVRIFEPFFTTKTADRGTGLGLATVFAIVTQMSGTISVDSKLGLGTTFTLDFPVSPSSS